eukprot:scaffold1573_cov173-Amphora_coffeaeformis.AAC.4
MTSAAETRVVLCSAPLARNILLTLIVLEKRALNVIENPVKPSQGTLIQIRPRSWSVSELASPLSSKESGIIDPAMKMTPKRIIKRNTGWATLTTTISRDLMVHHANPHAMREIIPKRMYPTTCKPRIRLWSIVKSGRINGMRI